VKHLIVYSLYGANPRYTVGAIKNAILSQKYPDFHLRFYAGESVPDWVTSTLKMFKNVEIVEMLGAEDATAMFWRFYALAELKYDYILVRDVDARLNDREIDMHYEFVESGKGFHIIKDHPTGHSYVISGGMLAAKKTMVHDIHKLIDAWSPKPAYCNDIEFLERMVWPRIKDDCLIHDEYYNTPGSIKSRTKKKHTLDMVGAAVNEDNLYIYDNDAERSLEETGSRYHGV
jgi:hypothetical protein